MANKHERWHADKGGVKGSDLDTTYVGKTYFHPKTGHLYRVSDVIFDSERERWLIMYNRIGDGGEVTYAHLPEDFKREGRFMEVKN